METDTHTFLRYQEDVLGIVRCLNLDQFILFLQNNRLQTRLPDIGVFFHRGFLYHALFRCHEKIFLIIKYMALRRTGCVQ